MARSSNRREEELDFQIVEFKLVQARGILCVFDVEFPGQGLTVCNMYIEFSRSGSGYRLGYPSTKRKRLPKDRQDFRLRLTPEKEREIYDEANYKAGNAIRRLNRSASASDAKESSEDPELLGLTLPTDDELDAEDGNE